MTLRPAKLWTDNARINFIFSFVRISSVYPVLVQTQHSNLHIWSKAFLYFPFCGRERGGGNPLSWLRCDLLYIAYIYADQQSFLISSQWALLSAKNAERQFVKHKWKARGWGKAAEVRVTLDTSAHAWDDIHSVAKKVDALLHTIPVTRENTSLASHPLQRCNFLNTFAVVGGLPHPPTRQHSGRSHWVNRETAMLSTTHCKCGNPPHMCGNVVSTLKVENFRAC